MEAIGTLAGGIAHDFNNILSGILGYSQLAQLHMEIPEKANKHIQQIINGAQRAADLTRQILIFSRQSEYQKQPFMIYLEIKEAPQLTGTEKIMVVDDEDTVRESCKALLENYGYPVQAFNNGLDALEAFKKNPVQFDLIITEMTMPGLTGANLAAEILKSTPDIPIVLCTGFSDNISQEKAIELGIRQFIQKPILNHDLVILIRKILDKKG